CISLLDWIFQIARKPRADLAVTGGLLQALDDVLHPQARLCSQGIDRWLTIPEIAGLVMWAESEGAPLVINALDSL
ncbi:hypothetical protein, partial [Candidatus Frankia nodulisporulans]